MLQPLTTNNTVKIIITWFKCAFSCVILIVVIAFLSLLDSFKMHLIKTIFYSYALFGCPSIFQN